MRLPPPAFAASRRRLVALAAAAGLAAALPLAARAEEAGAYPSPSRPVVLVVPQAAGGTNDIVGRLFGQKLAETLGGGASAIVDNRPGAGGNIGTQQVARAPADGHTLLMTISSSQAINPALYKAPGFDPVKDFAPVALVGAVPNVLLAHPSFPARTLAELIAQARAAGPGKIMYASAGNGTLNHLLGAMLNSMADIELQHVPYKGVAPAMNDVMGGQLPLVFASLPSSLGHIKAGRLRPLAVSSEKRSPALPEVPAIAEAVPGYSGTLWIGLFAPAATPPAVLLKLQRASADALASAELQDKLRQQGVELAPPTTPAQFAALLKADLAKWARIVKASGASVD